MNVLNKFCINLCCIYYANETISVLSGGVAIVTDLELSLVFIAY